MGLHLLAKLQISNLKIHIPPRKKYVEYQIDKVTIH